MRKGQYEADVNSPWKRCQDAQNYFGIGRSTLEKFAAAAGAKRKIGRLVLYNVPAIEKFLDTVGM